MTRVRYFVGDAGRKDAARRSAQIVRADGGALMGLPPFPVRLRNPLGRRIVQREIYHLLRAGAQSVARPLTIDEAGQFPFTSPPQRTLDLEPWLAVGLDQAQRLTVVVRWLDVVARRGGMQGEAARVPLVEGLMLEQARHTRHRRLTIIGAQS